MSSKVANLIAAELGILIGITGWLAYSQFHTDSSRASEGSKAPVKEFAASNMPATNPAIQSSYPAELAANTQQLQPMNQNLTALNREYNQRAVTQPYANPNPSLEQRPIIVEAPVYVQVNNQEPAAVSSDYQEPQPVYAPVQEVYYAPQVVAVDNGRNFRNNRREPDRRVGHFNHGNGAGHVGFNPQCQNRGNVLPPFTRVLSQAQAVTPSIRPPQQRLNR